MKRFGQIIHLRPEVEAEYRKIHVKIWPEIEDAIRASGITQLQHLPQRWGHVRLL